MSIKTENNIITSLCHLDDDDLYCKSCYRTINEIKYWNEFDSELKIEILDRIEARRNKDVSQIPRGVYCYTPISFNKETGSLKIKICPFWGFHPNKEQQDNGFCLLLNSRDWEEDGFGLLWDQCKSCNINDDID